MIYLDTSVLVSLLSADANTLAAATLMQSVQEPILLSSFGKLETVNALHLSLFRKEITEAQLASSLRKLEEHIQSGVFQLFPVPETAYRRGEDLTHLITPTIGTRSADLLHVAAALELGADSFYSFDNNQRKAAEAVHLIVKPWP